MAIQSDAVGVANEGTQVFEALANDRRRRTLRILHDAETPLSISALAAEFADREGAKTALDVIGREETRIVRQQNEDYVDQLEITLHHRHVPKLADAGLVEYDVDEKSVTLTSTENILAEFDE